MGTSNRFSIIFTAIVLLVALLCSKNSRAQTTGELQEGFMKYWQDDLGYLKKINAEKDSHRAAALVNEMREEMLPKLQKELQISNEWKKKHSQQEIKENERWTMNNELQRQVEGLQTQTMIKSSKQGGELSAAFQNYMKAMSMLMTRPKG